MARVTCLSIEALDPERLARFWAEALGWELEANAWTGTLSHVRHPEGWIFLEIMGSKRPKTQQDRMHFGLSCDDIEAEMDRLEALGATHAWEEIFWGKTNDYRNVVMRDPEGNEFCLGMGSGPEF